MKGCELETEDAGMPIIVDSIDFDEKIIIESSKKPVVVDFWAPWCAPCRALSLSLDKISEESPYAEQVVFAKVNIDDNPDIHRRFRIRSIPDVRIYLNGESVDSFNGAMPENEIRAFISHWLTQGQTPA